MPSLCCHPFSWQVLLKPYRSTLLQTQQDERAADLIPELSDPDKADQVRQRAMKHLTRELGMSQEQIAHLWATNPAFRSAEGQRLIHDAAGYREAMAQAHAAIAKAPPKPQAPGTATARPNGGSSELFRLADSGNMESYVKARNAGKGTR